MPVLALGDGGGISSLLNASTSSVSLLFLLNGHCPAEESRGVNTGNSYTLPLGNFSLENIFEKTARLASNNSKFTLVLASSA